VGGALAALAIAVAVSGCGSQVAPDRIRSLLRSEETLSTGPTGQVASRQTTPVAGATPVRFVDRRRGRRLPPRRWGPPRGRRRGLEGTPSGRAW
jgi:hypothetical protein